MKNLEWIAVVLLILTGLSGIITGIFYQQSGMALNGAIMIILGGLFWRIKDLEDKQ